jgi:pimeloyl-ACP methyl ester carboxylesterase
LLSRTPTPEQGRQLSLNQLRSALERGGRQRGVEARAADLQRALRAPQLQPPPRLAKAYGSSVLATVRMIREFNAQITGLEELAEAFEDHPDAEILRSLPGLGVVLAPGCWLSSVTTGPDTRMPERDGAMPAALPPPAPRAPASWCLHASPATADSPTRSTSGPSARSRSHLVPGRTTEPIAPVVTPTTRRCGLWQTASSASSTAASSIDAANPRRSPGHPLARLPLTRYPRGMSSQRLSAWTISGPSSRLAGMDSRHRNHEIDAPERPMRKSHVGLIVAGSMITGFVVALVLVIGPFAGAQEHVIMGTALLGWALGWALLAVLTIRWTDQPQRWAVVPAALMALAGASLLIFRPDANALNVLGWIWPLALIALAVYMTVQAHRNLRSLTRRLMLYPLFVALVIAGVGGSYETIQEQVDRSATAMPGHLIDIGGRRLYVHCTGSGSPTVVLVSGIGEASTYWGGWIAPAVAQNTTACVYDRAGQGWSDPPASPQDGVAVATDLHALLDRAHIPGPYVLVGHSTGGVYVRIFAARYPDQVAGMVMLDSQPNEALTGLPDFPSFYQTIRRVSALCPSLARLGVFRLFNQFTFDSLPAQTRDAERAVESTASLYRIYRDEFAELPMTLTEAAALTTIGDRPLIVVTAAKGAQAGWLPLQDKMAGLSTNSAHRVLPDTDHASLIDDRIGAAQASQAILDVVASVRSGTALTKA